MKNLKIYASLILLVGLMSCGSNNNGCSTNSTSDNQLSEKQEKLMLEVNAQVGMPAIKNFQERKLMKLILELRDRSDLICYCYIIAEMTGKPVFLGKCIGYGLPYATQYTNPSKVSGDYINGSHSINVLPQADPNGLFMPQSAEGTWVMLINPATNQPQPAYIEQRVLIVPFPLTEGEIK